MMRCFYLSALLCTVLVSACAHTPPECQGKFEPLNPVLSTTQPEAADGPIRR